MTWINIVSPIISLVLAIITLWGHVSSPVKKNKQRLDVIEARLGQLEADVDTDRRRSESQVELNVMILKTLSTLCKHELDGNHTAGLQACSEEIDSLIFKKGGSL